MYSNSLDVLYTPKNVQYLIPTSTVNELQMRSFLAYRIYLEGKTRTTIQKLGTRLVQTREHWLIQTGRWFIQTGYKFLENWVWENQTDPDFSKFGGK